MLRISNKQGNKNKTGNMDTFFSLRKSGVSTGNVKKKRNIHVLLTNGLKNSNVLIGSSSER